MVKHDNPQVAKVIGYKGLVEELNYSIYYYKVYFKHRGSFTARETSGLRKLGMVSLMGYYAKNIYDYNTSTTGKDILFFKLWDLEHYIYRQQIDMDKMKAKGIVPKDILE